MGVSEKIHMLQKKFTKKIIVKKSIAKVFFFNFRFGGLRGGGINPKCIPKNADVG